MKLGVYQYILSTNNWSSYTKKVEALAMSAKQQKVDLLMLPEYAGLEIGDEHFTTDRELFAAIQLLLDKYIVFFQELAQRYQLYILAGTIPVLVAPEKYVNRAYCFTPSGTYHYQDKLQLTEYEKVSHLLLQGKTQSVMETPWGKIGIAICYDSEFPEIVRALVKAGAWLILVPSYTVSLAGFYLVSLSSRARAIENQCCVAVSFLVGTVTRGTAIPEEAVGTSGVYGPADKGFPDNGLIAEGIPNEENMVIAEVFSEHIDAVRRKGDVRNYEDMLRLIFPNS
jgi:predicted amidohydrolase